MLWFILMSCAQNSKDSDNTEKGVILQDLDNDGYLELEDCDDSDPNIHPTAIELCDGTDNNCNGIVDEDVLNTYFVDSDGDGFGNTEIQIEACENPERYVENGTDCDDANEISYPGASEICDGLDNDCDLTVDNGLMQTFFIDSDEDGYGGTETEEACDLRLGLSSIDGDCNDSDPKISPNQSEICDELDNDCDGDIDEEVLLTFYEDQDNDGFGGDSIYACTIPDNAIIQGGDCDDLETRTYPGAPEICDEQDNNCDGVINEEAYDALLWFLDSDNDGYGDPSVSEYNCEQPNGYVENDEDCDDENVNVAPNISEICDGIDNNCNDLSDEFADDASIWYIDYDSDGFGSDTYTLVECNLPEGYVSNNEDCNDFSSEIHPNADEICDGINNDCDINTDEDVIDPSLWYVDNDNDGFGSPSDSVTTCIPDDGFVQNNTDCDDSAISIHPNAIEICDEKDNNCNDVIDEFSSDATVWYADVDDDGHGSMINFIRDCSQPAGYVLSSDDCDDGNSDSYPGAPEICDEEDNDCDQSEDELEDVDTDLLQEFYLDLDGDGFGDIVATESVTDCFPPEGYSSNTLDCDDDNEDIHPNAVEICDNEDNDCDLLIDDNDDDTDVETGSLFYIDVDEDGYGVEDTVYRCDSAVGYTLDIGDCDDNNPLRIPEQGGGCPVGLSCLDILGSEFDTGDGVYTIDPNGDTIDDSFNVYCDMTTDGGGWTSLINPRFLDLDPTYPTLSGSGSMSGSSSCQPDIYYSYGPNLHKVRGYVCGYATATYQIIWPNELNATDVMLIGVLQGVSTYTMQINGTSIPYDAFISGNGNCAFWNGNGSTDTFANNQCHDITLESAPPAVYNDYISGDLQITVVVGAANGNDLGAGFNIQKLSVR